MKLTPHFSLNELTKSQTALRLGLDNNPNPDRVASLRNLCEQVLEPVRKNFDRPVIINSGYRAEEVNTAIGSKPTSQHCRAQAAGCGSTGLVCGGTDHQTVESYSVHLKMPWSSSSFMAISQG